MSADLFEATRLSETVWAVRPKGALGTCGWVKGRPWTVMYVSATTPEKAIAISILRGTPYTTRGATV